MIARSRMVSVDPGYATAGVVSFDFGGNDYLELNAAAAYRWAAPTDFQKKVTHCVDLVPAALLEAIQDHAAGAPNGNVIVVLERFHPGKNAAVAMLRGMCDGALMLLLRQNGLHYVQANPMLHKQMLHKQGLAKDNGRKTSVEYMSHAMTLDNLFAWGDIETISMPSFWTWPKQATKWKDARQHTLDAAAIGAAFALAFTMDRARESFDHMPFTVTPAQHTVAVKVAEGLGLL